MGKLVSLTRAFLSVDGMDYVAVVGGGLVGCVAATCLARRGFRVAVYERNADPRISSDRVRPSINLTLCERGLGVLDRIGAMPRVRGALSPAYGRIIHLANGDCGYQPYGEPNQAIQSVRRHDLNAALLDIAEQNGVEFHFNCRCVDFDLTSGELLLEGHRGESYRRRPACVIAADGAFSAIRSRLQRTERLDYSQQFWTNGYKEIPIPTVSGSPALKQGALHIWPRDNIMAIAFPNPDNTFSCALHLPFDGTVSFAALSDDHSFRELMQREFPDLLPLIGQLAPAFFESQPNSMVTIRCSPWSFAGKILLIGDAAHSIFPSYGQGANAGFEDCAVLDRLIGVYGADWRKVFSEFERVRKADTDAIAGLCYEHFTELSNRVAEPSFQQRTQLEQRLHRMFPRQFAPLYSMITFSVMPYAEARRRSQAQTALINRLLEEPGIEEKLETEDFRAQLTALLQTSQEQYSEAGA